MSGGISGGRGLSFVSEVDIGEKRQKRQEEWEKVRKPDEPLECPEEEAFDGRTLYERLQEQKDKKQEEWDEQHKFKNMIRGLDNNETDFLDLVAKQQAAADKRRFDEESKEINEFRSAVSQLKSSTPEVKLLSKPVQQIGKKSQLALIAGAIKRKSISNEESTVKKSKLQSDSTPSTSSDKERTLRKEESNTETQKDAENFTEIRGEEQTFHDGQNSASTETKEPSVLVTSEEDVVTVLPGVGAYSDSSDSESSSSESDIEIPTHISPRIQIRGRMPYF